MLVLSNPRIIIINHKNPITMSKLRIYPYKDIVMLLASAEIGKALLENMQQLSVVRSNWNDDYAEQLLSKVDSIVEQYLGLDKKQAQKQATSVVNQIHDESSRNLSFLKKQIEVDFGKTDSKDILDSLGIPTNLANINNGDQEALLQVLYSVKKGMTPALKKQIVAKGTNPALIDNLVKAAQQLKDAEINQEILKATTKEVSSDAVFAFNELYSEVIGICKIASSIFHNDPVKKELFTFSKIAGRMSSSKRKEDQTIDE